MGLHREEGRFTIKVELSSEFDADYEGEEDGYEWLEHWKRVVRPRLVAAVFDVLRSDPAFDAIPVSRGANPDTELEIDVRARVMKEARTKKR